MAVSKKVTTSSGLPLGTLGDRLLKRYKERAPAAADGAMLVLDKQVKRTLSQPGRGRIYKRGAKTHQASAPGDPPAVDTGDLRRKTGWRRTGFASRRYGAATKVGLWMERGTRFILKRPWLGPALKAARTAMAAEVVKRMRSGG